jgi:PAS domain S-box-containing protein
MTPPSERQQVAQVTSIGVGVVVNRVFTTVNALCEMTGYEACELIGRNSRMLYPTEDDFQYVGREKYRQISDRGIGVVETRFRRKDGSIIDVLMSSSPIRPDNHSVGVTFTALDITELKQAERALKESREKYRLIFEHSPEMIVLMDVEGRVIEANSKIEELLACRRADIQGTYFWELPFWSMEAKIALPQWFERGLCDGSILPNELEFILKDGSVLSCSMQATRLADTERKVTHILCILSDVTRHRRAQNALREEKDRAQNYLDVAGVILVALDTQERVTLINRKGCAVLRRSEDEIVGQNWYDVALPERQREIFRITYAMLLRGETQAVESFENCVVTSEGEERTIAWRNTVVRDTSGQIVGTLSSGEDITDRKQAELSLRSRTEELRALNRFGDRAGASLLLEEVVHAALDGVMELLPVDLAALCLREGDTLVLQAMAPRGVSRENAEVNRHRHLGQCLCETAVRDGRPIYSLDTSVDKRLKWSLCAQAGFRSVVALPLPCRGISLGALCLYARKKTDFSQRAAFLEALVAEAAACLENALLYRRLETHARELEREVAERRRAEEQLRESREDFRRLAGRVLSAQESERSRIARELHDDITQRLALLAIETANVKRSEELLSDTVRKKLDALQGRLETIAADVQAVSRVLHPSILKDLGLADAVASECNAFHRREGINLSTKIDAIPAGLTNESTLCLFRILQESLWNIAKHSCAEHVDVALECRDSGLLLRIRDDGIGFDTTESQGQRGLGLASMRERTRLVSGTLSIQSQPGSGTTVEAEIPLTEHST